MEENVTLKYAKHIKINRPLVHVTLAYKSKNTILTEVESKFVVIRDWIRGGAGEILTKD